MRKRMTGVVLATLLVTPGVMYANESESALQEQIAVLLAQIEALQMRIADAQLSRLVLSRETIPESAQYTTELELGDRGGDVTRLQVLLAENREVYPEALVTGYFGELTHAAVKRLQVLHGLPEVGRVGPRTLQVLNHDTEEDVLSDAELDEIIDASVAWFVEAQEGSGHFAYEYHPFRDIYSDDDHIVRQAGALYGLGEVLRRDTGDMEALRMLTASSSNYLLSHTVEGSFGSREFHCLEISSGKCTMGGTALVLIGLISRVEADPQLAPALLPYIQGYTNYVLAMKKPGAGFRNYYYKYHNQTDTESWFSNGEALLALVRSHAFSPREDVQMVIDETFAYLAEQDIWDHNLYLWAMAAIKDMYAIDPDLKYVAYTKPFTWWRMESQETRKKSPRNRCAYLEGLASAHSVLVDSLTEDEQNELDAEINYWMNHSSALQLRADDTATLPPERALYTQIHTTQGEGGFLTARDALVQRIDFTQHCMNSFVQVRYDH